MRSWLELARQILFEILSEPNSVYRLEAKVRLNDTRLKGYLRFFLANGMIGVRQDISPNNYQECRFYYILPPGYEFLKLTKFMGKNYQF